MPPEETDYRTRWRGQDYRERPREYDPRLADRIIDAVANGDDLVSCCARDRDLPMPATFLRWVAADPILETEWREATRLRAEVSVEEMFSVAEDANPVRGRIRFDARRFHAERLIPKKYGPRAYVHAEEGPTQEPPDYGAEIRRKLQDMSDRHREEDRANAASPVGAGR